MPEVTLHGGEVDGLRLHYVVAGRGPAVVLLHGLGGFAESWRHTIPALASSATVLALDLPGFGRSAKPRAAYGLPYFARAVRGFLDALAIPRAALIGHSLGGAVAMAVAASHPARVTRVALVAAVVPGFGFRPTWIYRLVACRGVGELLALAGCPALYKAALARCFHAPRREEVDFFVDCAHAERAGPSGRAAYLATLRGVRADFEGRAGDYRRVLATLEVPVLLIHGREDRVVAPAHCSALTRGLRRVTVQWLPACGHFPQIEHPEAVNGWLAPFLASRAAASEAP
jgi:pimeloyl-ACP methyl ester carboxylesterase